jgi:hypothetical protein
MGMPGDLTHSCSGSPESVIKKALHALNEREAAVVPHKETGMDAQKVSLQPSKPAPQASPLLQRLRETSGLATSSNHAIITVMCMRN